MGRHDPVDLLGIGKEFYKSAEKLNTGPQFQYASLPVYCLFLQSVECCVKSYLFYRGMDDDGLRGLGRNLEATWQAAMDRGICKVVGECKELRDCISLINPVYQGTELFYFRSGRKKLPFIEHIRRLSGNLIDDLEKLYQQEADSPPVTSSDSSCCGN